MGTIVVGYIPTAAGEAALEQGVLEARRGGHGLLVVNSSPGHVEVDHNVVRGEQLRALEERLSATGLSHEVRQPASGNLPAEEITRAAEDSDAELVVIGMRRRTPVGRLIMSSVAQQVLLEAACPVLTVRADDLTP